MKRLIWFMKHAGLGAPGAAGLLLLLVLGIIQLGLISPLQTQLEQSRREARQERESLHRAMREQMAGEQDPVAQLKVFYKFLDTGEILSDSLAKLYNVAESQGVVLKQVEYRLVSDKPAKLKHYQITFPVQGSYFEIRRLLAGILAELPIASLDYVSLERKKINEPTVEVQIKLTLYLIDR